MKSSKEYLKNVNSLTTREDLYNIGKQIQRDAIDEAVKMCANDVILVENVAVYNSPTADDSKFGRNYDFYIDKQSILQVADKLKQEIG